MSSGSSGWAPVTAKKDGMCCCMPFRLDAVSCFEQGLSHIKMRPLGQVGTGVVARNADMSDVVLFFKGAPTAQDIFKNPCG
ncbi:unnamed protein product [Mycena citricolor]|uniref:Uncharacterized protein n=1 Tax=Mycena citricolor TaxID=2018698 RepID=A0AAD2Q183_9AGAR|nr:unnamed protein product [Mycena citricolor]CAK5276283.1 unnamed protein product [Mycena citricolor]